MSFDGPAIERWLTQNGQPVWGRVNGRRPSYGWLPRRALKPAPSSPPTTGSELKLAIDAEAARRGLPLLWPSAADLQKNHLDYATVSGAAPSTLAEIGRRAGAEGMLIGRASGSSAAANVRWTHLYQDRSSEFSGPLEGVNRAADLYAELFAASGNSRCRSTSR